MFVIEKQSPVLVFGIFVIAKQISVLVRGPGSVVDNALDCEFVGPGFEPRWRRHCGIQTVSFGKALLSSHVRRVGTLTGRSRVSDSILWAR